MHVSIAVDGDRMRVYIGREKIADARLFDGNRAKYLFISAPVRYDHGAQTLIGNLRKIGRAHVCTPVTNAHLVCRLTLEKKKNTNISHHTKRKAHTTINDINN